MFMEKKFFLEILKHTTNKDEQIKNVKSFLKQETYQDGDLVQIIKILDLFKEQNSEYMVLRTHIKQAEILLKEVISIKLDIIDQSARNHLLKAYMKTLFRKEVRTQEEKEKAVRDVVRLVTATCDKEVEKVLLEETERLEKKLKNEGKIKISKDIMDMTNVEIYNFLENWDLYNEQDLEGIIEYMIREERIHEMINTNVPEEKIMKMQFEMYEREEIEQVIVFKFPSELKNIREIPLVNNFNIGREIQKIKEKRTIEQYNSWIARLNAQLSYEENEYYKKTKIRYAKETLRILIQELRETDNDEDIVIEGRKAYWTTIDDDVWNQAYRALKVIKRREFIILQRSLNKDVQIPKIELIKEFLDNFLEYKEDMVEKMPYEEIFILYQQLRMLIEKTVFLEWKNKEELKEKVDVFALLLEKKRSKEKRSN